MEKDISVVHIETKSLQRRNTSEMEVCVECDGKKGLFNALVDQLQRQMSFVQDPLEDGDLETEGLTAGASIDEGPWFPRRIADLDRTSTRVLTYGADVDVDHPGFKDSKYRERRNVFVDIANQYRHGQAIPTVDYTQEETYTWGRVFTELTRLYPLHACQEHCAGMRFLQDSCGYRKDNVPQLEDVSTFLKGQTGFLLRPVAGYLSPRDFLAGLAFRVFHCTQYVRHASDPLYTPEPDCCHELLGHVPMLADKSFALFSQEIGLASLGASDEDIKRLASCYFFTIEFGLCKQEGQVKVYGAGLLSSISELKHAVSKDAKLLKFKPEAAIKQECRISTFQDAYYVTESWEEAKEMIRDFAGTIRKPFSLRYNPYTQTVDVLKTPAQIGRVIDELKEDLNLLKRVLAKVVVMDDVEDKEEEKRC